MNISEYLRQSILKKARRLGSHTFESLKISEWSPEFEQLMRNRLIMGSMRHSMKLHDDRPSGATEFHIKYIKAKLVLYEKTGNREMLVDIANLSLVEFLHSDHPMSHFKAVDRT